MDPNKDQDKDQKQGPLTRGIDAANKTRKYIRYGQRAKNLMQAGHAAEGVSGTGAAGEGAMGAAGAAEGATALAAGEGAAAGGAAASGAAAGGAVAGGAAAGGAAAGGAAASAPAWIVPAAIIGVCLLVVVIIVVFFGGSSNSASGSIEGSASPSASIESSPGTTPTCTSGDTASCLKNDFHILVNNASQSQLNDIYNIFALPMSYPKYKNLVNNGPYLTINLLSDSGGCHGYTPGVSINIYNYSYCQTMPFKNRQYLLIHESGHAINWRNARVEQNYVSNAWKGDPGCYESGYLKTYPLRCGSSCGISPDRESFAESIADTIMCSGGGTCQYAGSGNAYSKPIYNFPSSCPTTNNWTHSNIF